ncbi:MAG: hypothetical protein HRU09_15730 [Oligoflexales bacterium]|nr:hypothetical protein [Oligoflexales bacterium]
MTNPSNIAIRMEKETIRTRVKALVFLLGLVCAGMGYLSHQMPEGHLAKIFGIHSA